MKRTLFLSPPSFDGFDGGAGSRYQAKREVDFVCQHEFDYTCQQLAEEKPLSNGQIEDAVFHNANGMTIT